LVEQALKRKIDALEMILVMCFKVVGRDRKELCIIWFVFNKSDCMQTLMNTCFIPSLYFDIEKVERYQIGEVSE